MNPFARAALMLCAVAPAFASPNPEITAPAMLPRQLQTTIVGYFTRNGSWNSVWCNAGWKYCTLGSYAACGTIVESACNVGTSCINTSLYVDNRGTTSTCSFGTDSVCGTNTVYQKPGDTAPVTSIVCRASGSAGVALYRSFPDAGLGTASSSSQTLTSSTSSTIVTSTSSTQSTSPSASATPNPEPAKSKAWIAGPVIGALAVIAGIAFGCLFLRRRRAKKNPQQPPPMQQHQPGMGYGQEKTPQVGSHPGPPQYAQPPQPYAQSPQPYPQSPQPPYTHEYVQPPAQQAPHELGPRY